MYQSLVVVVVVVREHARTVSVLPVGEIVVAARATLGRTTHTTSSDSDMVGASSHVHTYDTRTFQRNISLKLDTKGKRLATSAAVPASD